MRLNTWTGRVLLCLLLIPSALYLATYPDLPLFGDFHDDTLYFVSAKSLALGDGYRIESLPGQPAQTKYPPLYPLLLSTVWRIQPEFPANLQWAGWLSWLAMPLLVVWLLPKQLRAFGLSDARVLVLIALFAINPYVVWLSTGLLTELYFLALTVGAMLILERARTESVRFCLLAGLLAGAAYLTRSAGLALLPAGFVYLWLRAEKPLHHKKAVLFAATMLPAILGWTLWARTHIEKTTDPSLTYYVDYFGYQLQNVSLQDFPLFLWKNVDGFLWGLGSLVVPKVVRSLLLKILTQVIAVAMISGVVRLVRRGQCELYAIYAAVSSFLLLIWHFPPDERFVMPLWPLAFTGLVTELEHLGTMLQAARRHRDRSQRVVAAGMLATVVTVFGAAVAYQVFVDVVHLPADAQAHRERRTQQEAGYAWIRQNAPENAAFFAQLDPLLYLYTGRAATSRPMPPRDWYHEDRDAMIGAWANVTDFARSHDLSYYFGMENDVTRNLADEDYDQARAALRSNQGLLPVFQHGEITIYQVQPPQQAAANGQPSAAAPHTEPHRSTQ